MTYTYNWHDIERKAMHFSVAWATEDDERGEAKTFLGEFFQIFNVRRHRFAKFEGRVKRVRYVCGRSESAYRYSIGIVFNTFFEAPEAAAVKAVEVAAQRVLSLRKLLLFSGRSLAELYDSLKMPDELLALHKLLDFPIDACYGIKKGS